MDQKPDRRFLILVLAFGLAVSGASAHWLSSGAITIRSGSRTGVPQPNAPVVGQLTSDQALFYPLTITWALLGAALIGLPVLTFFKGRPLLWKLCGYACAALLALGFTTLLVAWLMKPA